MNRYQVEGKDMDGITGYYVVDTHSEVYKNFKYLNNGIAGLSSFYSTGLSMNKSEMLELACKMNEETA
jgi:hypothetical protein